MSLVSQMGNGNEFDVRYKLLLIGEAGVGKTSLMKCLMGEKFTPGMVSTIGIDFIRKTLSVDGAKVQLEIWDTAGQEQYRTLTRATFRGSKGIILVYDVTEKRSFQKLTYWLKSIELEFVDTTEPLPVFLVGNKADLKQSREVTEEDGKLKADNSLARGFRETSVKTDPAGVQRVFESMAYILTETYDPQVMTSHMTPEVRAERGRNLKMDAKWYIGNNTSGSVKFWQSSKKDSSYETTISLGQETKKEEKKKCCSSG